MEQGRVTYTFERCLGRGGYGEVYLATAAQPGGLTKKVAVKVLRTGLAREGEALHRLRDEGRMLAMLDHPAILGVHAMTRIDGRVALVTEYVEGIDLSRCCKRDLRLPARAIAGILGEVAAALDTAANTRSPDTGKPLALIHRDIKPENIRLGKHGEVKLLDFGIARSTEIDREAQTVAGSLPFTPGYAAPECFNEGQQSAASDVYALGATGYRLLAAERLFEGYDTAGHLMIVATRERYGAFLDQRLAGLDVDRRLVGLITDMLAYDPAARPTAAEVQRACEALADELDGPTHVRWARAASFTEPKPIANAELTGRTMEADPMTSEAPSRPPGLIPSAEIPPIPSALAVGSFAPDTPAARPGRGNFLSPLDSLPIPDQGLASLPPGAVGIADVETVLLDRPDLPDEDPSERPEARSGWVGLLVKLALLLFAVGAAGTVVVAVVVGALWMWVG